MRTQTEVNRKALVSAIAKAEEKGPLANRSALFEQVAKHYNLQSTGTKEITPAIVYLRIREWNLSVKTPKGKKGRAAGVKLSTEQKTAMQAGRGNRASKFTPEMRSGFAAMKKQFPERLGGLIARAAKGSLKAATALKCLECADFQTKEIKFCVCKDCPLFAFRPYKPARGEKQEQEPVEQEIVLNVLNKALTSIIP